MFALTQQETSVLLSLLLSSEGKSFRNLQAEFEKAFPERFRACCAAVLLLEDATILRLPQRIAAWFLLSLCDVGVGGASPFLALLAKAASNPAAPPPERNFALQLLEGPLPIEVVDSTPRAYASYCDCRLLRTADVGSLQQKALAGLAGLAGSANNAAAAPAPSASASAASTAGCSAAAGAGPQRAPADSSAAPPAAGPLGPAAASQQQQQQQHEQRAGAAAGFVEPRDGGAAGGAAAGPARGLLGATWERPRPAVLTPLPSELKWLNPDLHTELLWDSDLGDTALPSTAAAAGAAGAAGAAPSVAGQSGAPGPGSGQGQGQGQLARDLLAAALRGPLLPAQQQLLLSEWDADPRLILRLGLTPRHLPALVEASPTVATEALLRLARWPERHAAFLSVLARSEMSLHSLEVVNRLTAGGAVSTEFVHLYITNCINSCESTQDKYVQKRLVRLVCVFLQSLIRNKVINIHDLLHEVQAFCINFSRIQEAAKLFRLLKQIEAGMRGADGAAAVACGNGGGEEALGPGGGGAAAAAGNGTGAEPRNDE